MGNIRALFAEFLGTFALVFVGAGAVITNAVRPGQVGLTGVAVASGLVVAVMVTALMRISGAHFNPAVTFGAWLASKIDAATAGAYVATQVVAGAVAALLLMAIYPQAAGEAAAFGTPMIVGQIDIVGAILIEAILTLFLASAYFGTVLLDEPSPVGGFTVGLVITFSFIAAGPLTGAALNPARAFGPALVAQEWTGHAAFWIGPLLGAAVAALAWAKVLSPKT